MAAMMWRDEDAGDHGQTGPRRRTAAPQIMVGPCDEALVGDLGGLSRLGMDDRVDAAMCLPNKACSDFSPIRAQILPFEAWMISL